MSSSVQSIAMALLDQREQAEMSAGTSEKPVLHTMPIFAHYVVEFNSFHLKKHDSKMLAISFIKVD